MQKFELDYYNLLHHVINRGNIVNGRNGSTVNRTGETLLIDANAGIPIISGRRIYPRNFLHELRWMLNGDTNVKYLNDNHIKIWDKWADENGDLGPTYGKQMRNFMGIDQIAALDKQLRKDPFSRRHIINLWNPVELNTMKLPPCYQSMQFVVEIKPKDEWCVSLVVAQRSCDLFIGLPYDMCFMWVLLRLVSNILSAAHDTYVSMNRLVFNFGSAHIYLEHSKAVGYYFDQAEKVSGITSAIVSGLDFVDFDRYAPENVEIQNYWPMPHIQADVIA